MQLAILFWCYKDVDLCENRLRRIRQSNPGIPVHVLYGGNPENSAPFERLLKAYSDSWYSAYPDRDPSWKWLNGDLLIADWYRNHGHQLKWDTLFIHQWDMLTVGSIRQILKDLSKGEILLSNVRPVNEVEKHWYWVSGQNPGQKERYQSFKSHLREHFNYYAEPLACLFIVACLPREFLDPYSRLENAEAGMLEYRVPTLARIFNIPFCQTPAFDGWWEGDSVSDLLPIRQRSIAPSSSIESVPITTIWYQLLRRDGGRIFHPFNYPDPLTMTGLTRYFFRSGKHRLKRAYWSLVDRWNRSEK